MPAPRTRGAATEARAIRGKSRKVAVACLQNATAFARSTTVRLADGTFAFDLQAGELGRMPVDPAFDPVVFDWDGAQMTVIDDRRRSNNLHVPEALSLLGPDTVSYGHWMAEEFPKFLTARQVVDLKGIPILIDADIPPQHRQSIVAFVGENHPIITVPRNLKVTADRLWVVTNWLYSPKFLTTDRDIDVDALAYPPTHFANVFSKAWDDLETLIGGVEAARARVFVSRDPKRHRNSANHTEVLALLEARGFQDVRPGELSFLEQFRLYRSASRVVVQAGSAATGLFMCRPGTRVCHLSQVTAMPLIPIWSALMAGLKVDTTILLSKVAERHAIYEDFSSYTVDVAALGNLVAEWEETPFE
ncbi:MAG: glycosyltransferase family 61 protein [Pseudomonadota bacterium]